jgi:methionyl-tRNA formyltransferase
MKIVLLCSSQPNHLALAGKIAAEFNLVGLVVERKVGGTRRKLRLKNIVTKLIDRLLFGKIIHAWSGMLDFYRKRDNQINGVESFEVSNINDESVRAFIENLQPDLVMVSGTSMVRKNILSIPLPVGMINLHTGLSPYIKGGPNCTNWCLADDQFHLIGNSIMWIDAGIDSGDLITTSIVRFSGEENLKDVHIKVMEEAHAIYLVAVKSIENKTAKRTKQNTISTGKTYYSKDWNFEAKMRLLRNFRKFPHHINSESYNQKIREVVTVI